MRIVALIAPLLLASAGLFSSAQAASPHYVYANSMCPATQPWLIGYARFTHKPVCTNACPATIWCYDFAQVRYHRSRKRAADERSN